MCPTVIELNSDTAASNSSAQLKVRVSGGRAQLLECLWQKNAFMHIPLLMFEHARVNDMDDWQQQQNSGYARRFQEAGAHEKLTAEKLAEWVTDPEARAKYVEAFRRSDFEAMLNYYKCNYPKEPYLDDASPLVKVKRCKR